MIERCNADHPIKQASLRSLFAGGWQRDTCIIGWLRLMLPANSGRESA